jgi:hypothetical protein
MGRAVRSARAHSTTVITTNLKLAFLFQMRFINKVLVYWIYQLSSERVRTLRGLGNSGDSRPRLMGEPDSILHDVPFLSSSWLISSPFLSIQPRVRLNTCHIDRWSNATITYFPSYHFTLILV